MKHSCAAAFLVIAVAGSSPLLAQSVPSAPNAEDKARVEYEAAKAALREKKPQIALDKLERVIGAFGRRPDVLCVAAEAAFQVGNMARAKEFAGEAARVADDAFRKSPAYQGLVLLATRIDVEVARLLEAKAKGYWVDSRTALAWSVKDNGRETSGEQAAKWCKGLRVGGFSDWRRPTIDELTGIYDTSIKDKDLPKIKAPLELSPGGWWVWSGTPGAPSSGRPSGLLLYFYGGSRFEVVLEDVNPLHLRAMCVRGPGG